MIDKSTSSAKVIFICVASGLISYFGILHLATTIYPNADPKGAGGIGIIVFACIVMLGVFKLLTSRNEN